MAAYDEESTVEAAILRVLASPLCAELIIVDDGSRDKTPEIAKKLEAADDRVRVLNQGYNQGRGAPAGHRSSHRSNRDRAGRRPRVRPR
jgi:glycosyltransferase involved in cell wall biosynthesis